MWSKTSTVLKTCKVYQQQTKENYRYTNLYTFGGVK